MGVPPGDTRDELGRETFHPFSPDSHLFPNGIPTTNWLHKYNKHPVVSGPNCCSDHSIAFHYITPNRMYVLEYMIYHLHPFGVHHVHDWWSTTWFWSCGVAWLVDCILPRGFDWSKLISRLIWSRRHMINRWYCTWYDWLELWFRAVWLVEASISFDWWSTTWSGTYVTCLIHVKMNNASVHI